ncbi:MAG: hypothetical protein ACRDS0_37290 [Pseudonocardiaceae bacterium]
MRSANDAASATRRPCCSRSSAGPIGYVTRDPELMRLATMLTHVAHAQREHPMVVAARWIQRGYRSLP